MKVEVTEERWIGGIVIRPFYGPSPLPHAIYDTLDLCFPNTKTKKSKTTTTMTTDNVNCDHGTVR